MKVTLDYDTVAKTASVKQDGKDVENLKRLHLYPTGKAKFGMEMHTGAHDDEHDMHTMTHTVADDGSMRPKTQDDLDEETKNELKSYYGIDDE